MQILKPIISTILMLSLVVIWPQTATALWFDASWDYRVSVTIDATQVDSTLTNFPVYVDLSDLPADFHTNVKSDGCDIRVVESDETTETAFELVSYDAGSDTGELHFMADSLSSSVDTVFYIYYGNSGASCYATNATYGAEAVWTGYLMVSHGNTADSTGNLTFSNTSASFEETTNVKLGATARRFDGGGGDEIRTDYGSYGSPIGTGDFTIQAWVRMPQEDARRTIMSFSSSAGGYADVFELRYDRAAENYYTRTVARAGTSGQAEAVSSTNDQDDTYKLFHASRTGTTARIYRNGTLAGTSVNAENVVSVGSRFAIGGFESFTVQTVNGELDEYRLATSELSADWISFEYTNQNTPTTAYTIGTQETDGGGGGAPPRRIIKTVYEPAARTEQMLV